MQVSDEPCCKKVKLTESENPSSVSESNTEQSSLHSHRGSESTSPKAKATPHKVSQEEGKTEHIEIDVPMVVADSLLSVCSTLNEADVGILEYVDANSPGISGILKQRYSDFVVHEIDISGGMIKLKDTTHPNIFCDTEKILKDRSISPSGSASDDDLPSNLLNEDDLGKLMTFSEESACDKKVTLSEDNDKEHRTLVHKFIRQRFKKLDTLTVTLENGGKSIQVKSQDGDKKSRNRKPCWPSSRPSFCHFTLYKENKDTMDAINLLSRMLHVRPNLFTYAGTKDRRAVTTQRISGYRITAERMFNLNKNLRNIALGDFAYSEKPIKLGDLNGNDFTVVLRDVENTQEEIKVTMESFKDKGFVNYFGMQRFGTGSVPTFDIGKAILSCNWEDAVDLIMKPREGEPITLSKARRHWFETRDASGALNSLKQGKCLEGHLLEGLAKYGSNNYCNALQRIPRNTRLLYLHSYQSLVWNLVVSRRMKEFGLQPVAGDLVIDDTSTDMVLKDDACGDCQNAETTKRISRSAVKELTEDDIMKGTYQITDIVMPLPGYDIKYPGNNIKEWYKDIMDKDSIDINNMRHKVKDYSLSGTYRYIVVKPTYLNWSIIPYDDYRIPMIQTDFDQINNKPAPMLQSHGRYNALKMEFTLPPSTYATMAMREITKADSSTQHQSKLSRDFLEKEDVRPKQRFSGKGGCQT